MNVILLFIITVVIIVALAIGLYIVLVIFVKKIFRISRKDAEKKIAAWVNHKPEYHICTDIYLNNQMWNSIQEIIGEPQFEKLKTFSKYNVLWESDFASGIPVIAFTIPFVEEDVLAQIQILLEKQLKQALYQHSLCTDVLVTTTKHPELRQPVVLLMYAENEEQEELLHRLMYSFNHDVISSMSGKLYDDEEKLI